MSKGAFIYQQIELTTAEWATNTTVYPASVWLFERLSNGKFNMKLSDGVHKFSELQTVMQDVQVNVKTNNATTYILRITTAAGTFETPNLKGGDGKDGAIAVDAPSDTSPYGRKAGGWVKVVEAVIGKGLSTNDYSNEEKTKVTNAIKPKDITVATTLTGLSINNYSIKVTLTAASALSFASTPHEGWECMIDIKNTGSAIITQALPNSAGWQCDNTSIKIAAGKIASISVRYVHGTYVVLSKGN